VARAVGGGRVVVVARRAVDAVGAGAVVDVEAATLVEVVSGGGGRVELASSRTVPDEQPANPRTTRTSIGIWCTESLSVASGGHRTTSGRAPVPRTEETADRGGT